MLALVIETLPNLANGITYRAYQADRPLTAMPTLVNDQTPNIDEVRTVIDYQDSDKNGTADGGAAYGFGTMPPLDRLEHLYCEVIGILTITTAGSYQFRLTAEDGARLEIDGSQVINNSSGIQSAPQVVTSSALSLSSGLHNLVVKYWNGAGSPRLKLEWLKPGSGT